MSGRMNVAGGGPARRRMPARSVARMISARDRRQFPYATYGKAYLKRGHAFTRNLFGETWRSATPMQREDRQVTGYTGRGAYFGRMLGKMAGGYLGQSGAGGRLGNALENAAIDAAMPYIPTSLRSLASSYRGRGSYAGTTGNALMGGGQVTRPMSSVMNETGDIIITHREFIKAITPTSADFQTQYFQALNPGLSGLFPWLSQIAQYFEEYELQQCVFEFKSLVTEGNNAAAGEVIMATQYNPLNAPFVVQGNMENYDYAASCKMTDNMAHGVECDPSKNAGTGREYVRTGPVPPNQDAKTYDLGVTQFATVGAAPNLTIGNLYVYYTVRLSKAKVLLRGASSSLPVLTAGVNCTTPLISGAVQYIEDPFGFGSTTGGLTTVFPFSSLYFNEAHDPTKAFTIKKSSDGPTSGSVTHPLGFTVSFPAYVNAGLYHGSFTIGVITPNSDAFGSNNEAFNTVRSIQTLTVNAFTLNTTFASPLSLTVSEIPVNTAHTVIIDFTIEIISPTGTQATFSLGYNNGAEIGNDVSSARLLITQLDQTLPDGF